jgi:tetratricopeptide (TPR) repeat protein
VVTDLGTMYLYTGNADQAIAQYKKAIAINPNLYQAYFNLGIAYGEQGDKPDSAIAFTKAISLAPDDDRREQAKQMYTKYTGQPADEATKIASSLKTGGAPAASSKPGDFHSSFEDMLRNLPIAGRKISSVQWPAQLKAKVLMDNFPMDAMPPFAKDKFMTDLKAGIDSTKSANKVSAPVEVDIVDAQSGRVMQTVTQ